MSKARPADFAADPDGYDVVTCIGAPFAIGSFEEALVWMLEQLKPGGVLAIGDEFVPVLLPPDLVAAEQVAPDRYRTLSETLAVLERRGLELTSLVAATTDDWDNHTSGSWRAVHAWHVKTPRTPTEKSCSASWRRAGPTTCGSGGTTQAGAFSPHVRRYEADADMPSTD